jgi:hypothetical protein
MESPTRMSMVVALTDTDGIYNPEPSPNPVQSQPGAAVWNPPVSWETHERRMLGLLRWSAQWRASQQLLDRRRGLRLMSLPERHAREGRTTRRSATRTTRRTTSKSKPGEDGEPARGRRQDVAQRGGAW